MSERNPAITSIRSFIFQKFPAARKRSIDDETALLESGIIDSLGILDVVGFLERSMHITIADDELIPDNFSNINCIASFVECKRSKDRVSAD